jgi:hypothetical protein
MPKRKAFDQTRVDDLVARTEGVCRRRDLERAGIPPSTVSFRLRPNGPWRRMFPGVILTSSGVPTQRQLLLGALLYAGGGGMLSGHTALVLYGVRAAKPSEPIHVLIPHGQRRRPVGGLMTERTRRVPAHRSRTGLPCVPVERAVIDAVRGMNNVNDVRALLSEVVQRGMVTVRQLAEELRIGHKRGTALPPAVLNEVTDGVRSAAEAQARHEITAAGLPRPLWNHDVYDASGRWLGRPDVIWPELGVVLEIDSFEWHLSPHSYRRTQARQRRLARVGLVVLPIAPAAVRDSPKAFIEELRIVLEEGRRRRAPAITVRSPGDVRTGSGA